MNQSQSGKFDATKFDAIMKRMDKVHALIKSLYEDTKHHGKTTLTPTSKPKPKPTPVGKNGQPMGKNGKPKKKVSVFVMFKKQHIANIKRVESYLDKCSRVAALWKTFPDSKKACWVKQAADFHKEYRGGDGESSGDENGYE